MANDKKSIIKEALVDFEAIQQAAEANAKKRLAEEAVLFPSPTTTTTGSNARKAFLKRTGQPLGQLTPEFCEWLQGFPLGWTELNALEIQWYLNVQKSLRKLSKKNLKEPRTKTKR